MTTYTEATRASEIILSECCGTISRESVTIVSGTPAFAAGMVLGQVTTAGATAAAFAGNTGTGTVGTITVSSGAKVGAYKVVIVEPGTNVGTFTVENPDGVIVGTGVVASPFSGGGLAFTISDATDFVAGDGFTITVAAGSGQWKPYDDALTGGAEVAAGIALEAVDASGGAKACAILTRMAEYKTAMLAWHADADSTSKAAAYASLAARYLIGR